MKKGTVFIENFNEFIEGKTNSFTLFELIEVGREEDNPNTLFGTRQLLTFQNLDNNQKIYMFDHECCGKLEVFTPSIEKRIHTEFIKLQTRLHTIRSTGINFE